MKSHLNQAILGATGLALLAFPAVSAAMPAPAPFTDSPHAGAAAATPSITPVSHTTGSTLAIALAAAALLIALSVAAYTALRFRRVAATPR